MEDREAILIVEYLPESEGSEDVILEGNLLNREYHEVKISVLAKFMAERSALKEEVIIETLIKLREVMFSEFEPGQVLNMEGVGAYELIYLTESEEEENRLLQKNTEGIRKEVLLRPSDNIKKILRSLDLN